MKKALKKAPAKERIVPEVQLTATVGGSGYSATTGDGDPNPDPNAGT